MYKKYYNGLFLVLFTSVIIAMTDNLLTTVIGYHGTWFWSLAFVAAIYVVWQIQSADPSSAKIAIGACALTAIFVATFIGDYIVIHLCVLSLIISISRILLDSRTILDAVIDGICSVACISLAYFALVETSSIAITVWALLSSQLVVPLVVEGLRRLIREHHIFANASRDSSTLAEPLDISVLDRQFQEAKNRADNALQKISYKHLSYKNPLYKNS